MLKNVNKSFQLVLISLICSRNSNQEFHKKWIMVGLIDFKLSWQYFNIRKLLIRINSYFTRKTKKYYYYYYNGWKFDLELGWDNKK